MGKWSGSRCTEMTGCNYQTVEILATVWARTAQVMDNEARKVVREWSRGPPADMKSHKTVPDLGEWTTVAATALRDLVVMQNEVYKTAEVMQDLPGHLVKGELVRLLKRHETKPAVLVARLLAGMDGHPPSTHQEIKEVLRAMTVRQSNSNIFRAEKHKGSAYNMVTDVLGEKEAGKLWRERKKRAKTYDLKKLKKETAKLRRRGTERTRGRGPTGCPAYTPPATEEIEVAETATTPSCPKKRWLLAHHK